LRGLSYDEINNFYLRLRWIEGRLRGNWVENLVKVGNFDD